MFSTKKVFSPKKVLSSKCAPQVLSWGEHRYPLCCRVMSLCKFWHGFDPDPGVRVRIRTYSVIRTKVRKRKQYGVRVKKENEVQVQEVYGFISKKEVWSTEKFWTRRCVNGTGTELFSKVVYGVRNVGRKCTEFSNIIFQPYYKSVFYAWPEALPFLRITMVAYVI